VVEPKKLDADGSLWRPGIREGVQPGSAFHRTEYFGPVLGIMAAETLDEAIEIVNAIEYGLTSGLHALDSAEIDTWLAHIEAGNVYVNRGTTGAIVQRQPFGGWKKSAVGAGTKAGGPHYLFGFGSWADAETSAPRTPDALAAPALAAVPAADREWVASALASDAVAWTEEFSLARDVTALESEQNVLRYAAVPVTVRVEDASSFALVRVVAAGVRAGSVVTVSSAAELTPAVRAWLEGVGVRATVEDTAEWGRRAARLARTGGRVRLLGGSVAAVAEATGGSPSVAVYAGDVTRSGQVELLPFLREQAVSITAHRFGTPRRYEVPALVGR